MSDTFVTAVPPLTYGPNGIVIPPEDSILTGVQTDINSAFGGGLNPQLSTPQGQIASTETAVIGDSYAAMAWLFNQFDPALNSGRGQDAIGRIYFMTRIAAQPTVQNCILTGLATTPIPIGALATDPNTNLQWICTQSGSIDAGGTVTLEFSCLTNGPIAGPATLNIAQSIYGWESIVPTGDAVLGNNVESSSQFEQRRQASVAANAIQILDAIQGLVLALSGVLDCYCYENDNATPLTYGGVVIGPNSIYVCVLGGTSLQIAQAMWTKKGTGCAYTGNTYVVVTDPNPYYNPPAPSYIVSYTTPTIVPFAVLVTLKNNSGIPANALSLIQTAIVNAFAGLDGGSRAKIGSTVFASRYYTDVAALGTWATIISIQLGISAGACVFTGSITGTTLTVSSITIGSLSNGLLLQDAGLLQQNTLIQNQVSGTPGGAGVYQVSIAQMITSEQMTATNLVNDVTMNINQAPAVSAANIQLALI